MAAPAVELSQARMAYYTNGFEELLAYIKMMLSGKLMSLDQVQSTFGFRLLYDDDRTAFAAVFLDIILPSTPCNLMNAAYKAPKLDTPMDPRQQHLLRLAQICLQRQPSAEAELYMPYGPLYEALQPAVADAKRQFFNTVCRHKCGYDKLVQLFKRYLAASASNTVVTLCKEAKLHLDINDRRILTYLCGFVKGDIYDAMTPANYEVHSALLEHLITGLPQADALLLKVDRLATLCDLFLPCFASMLFEDILQQRPHGGLEAARTAMLQQRLATNADFAARYRGMNGQPTRH